MIENEAMMYSILKKYSLYNKREDYIDVCYIGFAKAINTYDHSKGKESTYIYRCIENELINQLRKENKYKRKSNLNVDYFNEDNYIYDNNYDFDNFFVEEEKKNKLIKCISSLNSDEQKIINYSYGINCEKLSQRKIAKMLGLSLKKLKSKKANILLKLRNKLGDNNEDNYISK